MHTNKVCVPLPDFLWELCIGDQETGDVVGVEEADKGVDFRVHDWLTHQREGTVLDCQALLVPLRLHSRDTWKERGLKVDGPHMWKHKSKHYKIKKKLWEKTA